MSVNTLSRDAGRLVPPQIGVEDQRRTSDGTARLIGVGGIGCAAVAVFRHLANRKRSDSPACAENP